MLDANGIEDSTFQAVTKGPVLFQRILVQVSLQQRITTQKGLQPDVVLTEIFMHILYLETRKGCHGHCRETYVGCQLYRTDI